MNHFDEMTALLCLEGQLDAAHAQEVRAHAASSAVCRELLHALENRCGAIYYIESFQMV